ncbi:glutathione S-transferase family protein [Epibacterium sp. Ofav1-8]|uniref:glutathione S-transferase family protein n=1 Tax=Epibacterium sp. Ofav1-8 TaxID=2917735 RepID=UPI001EF3EAFF|nr:glutathione S-transferase family protein [Epibacterium sp. Ofav1-8]MCG7622975.1 glutathione S-transferase family protein [Epibacterium sp. Ofav1-8]
MTTPLRLHYAPDNASLIVRLALEELGLPYETLLVDRSQQAQRAPEYLRLNPNGTIPVLETPDGALFETAAILLWLSDQAARLAPGPGSAERGRFLTWLFWCSNTLHVDLRQYFYPEKYVGPDPSHHAQLRQMLRLRLQDHLRMVDAALAVTPALTGKDQPTLLDLYLPCLLRWTKLYAETAQTPWFDLSAYPALSEMCRRAEARNSTKAAQIAEGLGPTPFTAPTFAIPPEGSAT